MESNQIIQRIFWEYHRRWNK